MEVAECRIYLNAGTDVPGVRVTPAEVLVLRQMHRNNAGKDPIHSLKVVGEIDRSTAVELKRLREKFPTARTKEGKRLVDHLFPGATPSLPESFKGVWPEVVVEAPKSDGNSAGPKYDEPIRPFSKEQEIALSGEDAPPAPVIE